MRRTSAAPAALVDRRRPPELPVALVLDALGETQGPRRILTFSSSDTTESICSAPTGAPVTERVYGLVKADQRAPGKIGTARAHRPHLHLIPPCRSGQISPVTVARWQRASVLFVASGAQQLTFFNGHYGGWCYLPMLGFLSFDREAEQYLCAAVLRPGKAVAADGTLGLLCRLLPLLRAAFPRARFLVRLDGGFATPEIFDFLDAEPRLDYVVAMAKNAVLQRHAESAMQVARAQSEVGGETAHVYTDTRYAAGTWDHERRVVIKAEVVRLGDREPRDNPRFVVTNLRQTPRFIYEKVYCARGDIENRIKELLDGLQIDRTSCCLFSANQLRVFLTAAAYVLMQELRLRAARTACARSQVTWLRDRLLKLGVHVVRSVRRVVLHLPRSTPHLEAWRHIALALGARAG